MTSYNSQSDASHIDEFNSYQDESTKPIPMNSDTAKAASNASPNSKKILTLIYCLVFWNFGLCVAIFGPTLLDLACKTSSSLSAMSMLYFMQNFTSLIGVFLSGVLLKKKKVSILGMLFVSTLVMPLCVAFMPVSSNILFLALVMILLGFNMGCVDNIANLAIMKLHSNNVSPYIQMMHFFYGVGAFLTPLIVKSYLNSNFDIKITHSTFNCYNIEEIIRTNKTSLSISAMGSTIGTTVSNVMEKTNHLLPKDVGEIPDVLTKHTEFTSNTKYAFWILAFIQLPAAVLLLLVQKKNLVEIPFVDEAEITEGDDKPLEQDPFQFNLSYWRKRFAEIPAKELTFLIAAMVFLFEGLQAAHGAYIFSYAVETYELAPKHRTAFKNDTHSQRILNPHHHHHNDEAYITALFWAFFSLGRLASIFIATKFSAPFMIFVDIIGCFVSACLMLMSELFDVIGLLYFATCLLGLFLSNTTPTIYSLTEIYIGSTPTLTSFVIICAASGEMILPVVVASLFDTTGPASLLVVELIVTILAALLFAKFMTYANSSFNFLGSISSFVWINPSGAQNEGSNLIGGSSGNYYSKMDEY